MKTILSAIKAKKERLLRSIRRRCNDQRGIAIILSIAGVALFAILALTFAAAAVRSQSEGKLITGILKSRIAAESHLQEIYSEISTSMGSAESTFIFPATSEYSFVLGPPGTPWQHNYVRYSQPTSDTALFHDGLDSAIHATIAGFDISPRSVTAILDTNVSWVISKDLISGQVSHRKAFWVIDESGKVDPTTLVKKGEPEGTEGERLGHRPSEISLLDVITDTQVVQMLQYTDDGGTLPDGEVWLSFNEILTQLRLTLNDPIQQQHAVGNIISTLSPYMFDYNAYFDTSSNDRDIERFPISESQAYWDGVTVADLVGGQGNAFDSSKATVTNAAASGIRWFNGGSTPSVNLNRITANMIDYFDQNSIPTTDVTVNTITDEPVGTYMGIENVPFLNEFVVTVRVLPKDSAPGYDLNVKIEAELVNMFRSLGISTWEDVKVGGRLSVIYNQGFSQTPIATPEYVDFIIKPNIPTASADPYSYYVFDSLPYTRDINLGSDTTVGDLYVTLEYATLALADSLGSVSTPMDFITNGAATNSPVESRVSFTDTSFKSIFIDVDDPRANDDIPSTWKWGQTWISGLAGTIGSKNTRCLPSIGGPTSDYEPYAIEPWDVSSACVANRKPVSLWELGAIHRAGPWQTINLLDVSLPGIEKGEWIGAYTQGDANLLSQLTMNSASLLHGQVNINTASDSVLYALFNKVIVSNTFDELFRGVNPSGMPAAMNDTLLASNFRLGDDSQVAGINVRNYAKNVADAIKAVNGTTGGLPFSTRSQMAGGIAMLVEQDTELFPTDAARESLFGKTVELTTARSNVFKIIGCSQIIQDVGSDLNQPGMTINGVVNVKQGQYDPGIDQIVGQTRYMATIYRDALNRTYQLLRFEYLDR